MCCVFPSTVDFDCITSPKSRHFAQVSDPLYTNTETPPPPLSPPLIPDRQLSLSLMFGRRRRAWCRRQAGHWWRLAPPYEGLYHQYYFLFFFLLPPLLSSLHVSDKCWLRWVPASICVLFQFEVLFISVSHFVSQAFSQRQRDLFLIQAPVFLPYKYYYYIFLWSLTTNSWTNSC